MDRDAKRHISSQTEQTTAPALESISKKWNSSALLYKGDANYPDNRIMAAAVPGEGGGGDEFASYFCSFALLEYFKIFGMY